MVGSGDGTSSSLSSEAFCSFISSSVFLSGKAIRVRFSDGDISNSDFASVAERLLDPIQKEVKLMVMLIRLEFETCNCPSVPIVNLVPLNFLKCTI